MPVELSEPVQVDGVDRNVSSDLVNSFGGVMPFVIQLKEGGRSCMRSEVGVKHCVVNSLMSYHVASKKEFLRIGENTFCG